MSHVDRASDLPVHWRKSIRSQQGSECVEVASTPAWTAVRDSKNPSGPALVFAPERFTTWLDALT